MSVLSAYVDGVALIGPGISDWPSAAAILRGTAAYRAAPTEFPLPGALPPAERRRTGRVVRLALAVGVEAATRAGLPVAECLAVFSSSGGDVDNCHEICQTLASADRQLSPTRFHNSVHNAPSGYWGIAAGARAASTALCAYDASYAAGLLEAFSQLRDAAAPVLLITYDLDYPPPLSEKRAVSTSLGSGLALVRQRSARSLARLSISIDRATADRMPEPELERLRLDVPAARSLPLLALLARGERGCVQLEYLERSTLKVEVEPC
jgi:Beta-ketoacyl synthase, N-terminal domain